jgi:uncharacterized lipoprotein YajG
MNKRIVLLAAAAGLIAGGVAIAQTYGTPAQQTQQQPSATTPSDQSMTTRDQTMNQNMATSDQSMRTGERG